MHDLRVVVHYAWRLLLLLLLSTLTFNAQEQPQRGAVSGVVVDNTAQSVSKALVLLRNDHGGGTGTKTNDTGSFKLDNVEPGTYTVTVSKDGYVFIPKGQPRVITVNAGTTTTGLAFKLVRAGAITGRVLDADGDPIRGASVQVVPWHPKKRRMNASTYATTDDRGEYRAYGITPGDYTVAVIFQAEAEYRDFEIQEPQEQPGGTYPTTYYPSTVDARQAAPVRVSTGIELQGIDVQLTPARGVKVTGRVTGLPDRPLFVNITLEPFGSPSEVTQARNALAKPTGEFVFHDVLPGTYHARARYEGLNNEHKLMAQATVEVGGEDLNGVQLSLHPPATVTGRISTPPGRTVPAGFMIFLGPRAAGDNQGGGWAQINPNGRFRMNDVPPGNYDVILGSNNTGEDDLYVQSIRLGTTDALTDGLQISEGTIGPLEVQLHAHGGTLACTVTNDRGEPVSEAPVLLVPDPPRQHQLALSGNCRTNANGTCTMSGITPGAYHAYAIPTDTDVDLRDPESLTPFRRYGNPVVLNEGERQQVQMTALPEE